MASLPEGRKPRILDRYPHMGFEDTIVWTRFLEQKAGNLSEVWYDLHVGTAVRVLEDMPGFMQRVSDAVSRKRIDVVARVGFGFWIIEVKPICETKAIGQALTYRDLFVSEFALAAAAVPVIVCELVEVDVIDTADSLGVLVFALDGVLE